MNSPLGQPVVSDLAKQFIEALRFQQRVEQYSAMFSAVMVDQYARKQSQSPELFDDAGQARWVTIGGERGADGHRHGGHPVKIDSHGKMLTGAFAGKTMGEAFGAKGEAGKHLTVKEPGEKGGTPISQESLRNAGKEPAKPTYQKGDRIRVTDKSSSYFGKEGMFVSYRGGMVKVILPTTDSMGRAGETDWHFDESQIEPAENKAKVEQPAKPGITLDTRANEAAKTGDQMGLFGDVANVPKGKATLDQVGTTKGHQMAMFDTKGDPDQMMMFDDGVTPEDRLMPEAKAGPKPFEPVLLGSSPKKSGEPRSLADLDKASKSFQKDVESTPDNDPMKAVLQGHVADHDNLRSMIGRLQQPKPVKPMTNEQVEQMQESGFEGEPDSPPVKQPESEAKSPELAPKQPEKPEQPKQTGPMTLADYKAYMNRVDNGEVTADEHREAHERFKAGREGIRAELAKMKKEDIAGWHHEDGISIFSPYADRQKKDQAIESTLRRMHDEFDKSPTANQWMFGDDVEAKREKSIAGTSDDQLKAHAASIAKERADRKARIEERQEAAANPKTVDDWVRKRRSVGGYQKLTPEQQAAHDEAYAAARREKEPFKPQKQTTVEGFKGGSEKTGNVGIVEGHHQKRNAPTWTVTVEEYLGDDWKDALSKAKALGGNYVNARIARAYGATPGFQFFNEDAAKKFHSVLGGQAADISDKVDEREAERRANQVDSLADRAAAIKARAEESLGRNRMDNTARRARMAASAEGDARKELATAKTMETLSKRIEDGKANHLKNVRNKAQVDELDSMMNRAKWNHISALQKTPEYQNKSYNEREAMQSSPATKESIAHAEYPYPYMHRSEMQSMASKLEDVPGLKMFAKGLLKMSRELEKGDYGQITDRTDLEKLREAIPKMRKHHLPEVRNMASRFNEKFEAMKRLEGMDIRNTMELRAALREYHDVKANPDGADPIKEAERKLKRQKIEGFFPTPRTLVERMLDHADIEDDHEILEPSAGIGSIMDAVKERHPDAKLHGIEKDFDVAELLKLKGHSYDRGDFLEHTKKYDRIVMNPPFEHRQDEKHVKHAYDLLKPGGKLVAITGSGAHTNERSAGFQDWLSTVGAKVYENPEGSFDTDEAFRKTGVNTRMVIISKPTNETKEQYARHCQAFTPLLIDRYIAKKKSISSDDLWLDEESMIDRYEWVESQHPRNPAGTGGGGQFRSTKLRELPSTDTLRGVDKSHDFHHSKLPPDLQKQALTWSAELHRLVGQPMNTNYDEQLAKDAGRPMTPEQVQQLKEQRWKSVDKNEVRKLLDQMNQMDKQAKLHGIDLASHVNASRLIPPELAMRLNGGRRFFDPSRVKAKAAAQSQAPQQQAQPQREFKRWQDDPAKMAEYERRKGLTPSQSKPVDYNNRVAALMERRDPDGISTQPVDKVVPGTVVQNKNRPNHIINENLASHINGEKKAIAATPEPEQSSFSPTHGLSSQAAGKVDRAAADTVGDGDQSKVDHFKGLIMDAWKLARDQAQEHNAALNTLQNLAGGPTFAARLSQHLARGGDVASVQGFDTVVDHARRHFPHLVGGADDAESGVVDMFRTGMKPVPQPWHDEVVDQAVQMAPQGFFDEYVPSAANASHDEPVPFSVIADCRHFVQCYWLRSFKDYYAGKSQMSFNWDESAHPRASAGTHEGGQFVSKKKDSPKMEVLNPGGSLKVRGTTQDVQKCDRCGRADLKKTIVVEHLDADGNGTGHIEHFGSECISKIMRKPALKIEKEAAEADHEAEATKRQNAERLAKRPASTKNEANANYRKTNRHVLESYFAEKDGMFVRIDGKDPADVKLFTDAGFKKVSEPVQASALTTEELKAAKQHYPEWVNKPKPKQEIPDGFVAQPRAKAGGETSEVDGKFYKGGALMPVHGLFSGQEKPEPKKPKNEGTSPVVNANEDGKGVKAVRERSKAEVEAERSVIAERKQWELLRSGPIGDMFWTGEKPGKFGYDVKKKLIPFLQSLPPEKVKQIGDWSRQKHVDHELATNKPPASMSDSEARKFIEDDFDHQAEYTSKVFVTKKLSSEVPGIGRAIEGMRALTELPEPIKVLTELEAILNDSQAKDKYSTAFNPTLHPRDSEGRFSAVGDSFKTAAYGLKDQMHVKIDGIDNNLAKVSNGFMSASVPVDSLEQLKSDTTGDYSYLKVFGESKSPEVNKIVNGQAKFIGKGADGVVHDVGDSVVKSSTTVPYHPVGGGTHLTPDEAVESFAKKINTEKAMHAAGIPGVMKTRNGMHGNKIFSIRPKLSIGKRLTNSQLKQVEESIKAMHAAGYSVNDEIQVGTDESGNVFHYDLGQSSSGATDASKKDDWGHYRRFVEANNKMTDLYSISVPSYHKRMMFTSSLIEADLAGRYALRHHPMHAAAPTEAQKEAGNYRMSHIKFQGLDITIETPKGRSRRPEWPTMKAHYGYFKRTEGADGDHVDCFVGPDKNADTVYIIDQVKPSGQFDEHKCLIGFPTREAAIAAYRGSYSIGWRVGKVTVMTMDGFKNWLKSGESCKPAAAC